MSAGMAVESLMAGTEIAVLWGQADRGRRSGRKEKEREIAAGAGGGARSTRASSFTRASPTQAAVTRTPAKRLGEMAEAAFLARASRLKFGVACPWGDSDRYDFIVDAGKKLWKVQVKSAHRVGEDGTYSFRAHGSSLAAYQADEIDVLVAYVVPEDVWYVFPVRELGGLRSLKLFPGSRKKRSKFEKYREAWWILRGRSR